MEFVGLVSSQVFCDGEDEFILFFRFQFEKGIDKCGDKFSAVFVAETIYAFVESICDTDGQTGIDLNPIFIFGQFSFSDLLRSGRAKCHVPELFLKKRMRGVIFPAVFLSCCFFLIFISDNLYIIKNKY